jgi:hypothetical protein
VKLADVYVFYDDVQFSKGSFTNRVQVKAADGVKWMTVPLVGHKMGQAIEEVKIKPKQVWVNRHLALLEQNLGKTEHFGETLELVKSVYDREHDGLASLARDSFMALADYFGICTETRFMDVAELDIDGASSQRVYEVVKALDGTEYITGHGARNYLDHELFESAGIQVKYMAYECREYPQQHGEFTPYVSTLDLIANCGKAGTSYICSEAVYWKEFLDESKCRQ